MASGVAGWALPHLRPSPPPSLPDGFPLAATRAVTHAVKILPSPGNYKQKMRLDSRALRGIRGCSTDTPGKGLGTGGAGGSPSTPAQGGTPPPPSQLPPSCHSHHPRLGAFREAKVTTGEGRGPGMLRGGFFPWSQAWAGKASHPDSHTDGTPPPAPPRRDPWQQELITGIRN